MPLAVEFPFPAWATRLSESAGEAPRQRSPAARPVRRLGAATDDDDARRSEPSAPTPVRPSRRRARRVLRWSRVHAVPAHRRLARRQDAQGPHPARRAGAGAARDRRASRATHEVDAVLVAGDLYDTAAPTADAQKLVVRTLLGLARRRRRGDRDRGQPRPRRHLRRVPAASRRPPGSRWSARSARRATAAWSSSPPGRPASRRPSPCCRSSPQRYAVRAAELVADTPAEHTSAYDQQLRDILGKLTAGFRDDAVNLVMAHLTVLDGADGRRRAGRAVDLRVRACPPGSSRSTRTTSRWATCTGGRPMAASCPVHYSGAPLAVDFGEQENTPVVCVVEAAPGTPAAGDRRPDPGRTAAAHRARHRRGTVGAR